MSDLDVDELLAVCRAAFQRSSGPEALEQLGFWDLLDDLADPTSWRMAMAAFEAQGAVLASSGALAGLLGQPYSAPLGRLVPRAVEIERSGAEDPIQVLIGPAPEGDLVIDRPGHGAAVFQASQLELRAVDVPGRVEIHEILRVVGEPVERLEESIAAAARDRALAFGRVALGFEMLGAARSAVDLAVEHARDREQFGRPIGAFQAVQHLLAWAMTDCEALAAAAEQSHSLIDQGGVNVDAIVKALAGRNGMRACERSLQVLGAIGFTAEHDHHHFHSRVLVLDAMLGSRGALTRRIGEQWRRNPNAKSMSTTLLEAVHLVP